MRETRRIYYLDFIRAIAMIAGIFFHSSLSFLKDPVSLWPVHDPQISSGIIDLFTWASHRVRMPLFFIVCGYFTYMLFEKYDLKDFIKNRTKKIVIPFIVSMIVIVPITIDSFITDGQFAPYAANRMEHYCLMHLWFLYFLIIFYTLFLILKHNLISYSIISSNKAKLIFVLAITAFIFFMKDTAGINASPNFIPDFVSLGFYLTFYLVGVYFYKNPNLFKDHYNKKTYLISITSLIICPVIILLKLDGYDYLMNIFTSLFTVSTLIILIELSKKLFNKNSKLIRYMSDSSYWLYLIHIPIVVTLQNHLLAMDMSKEIKFLITSVVTLIITLSSYQLLIRYTVIGTYLHGKRNKNEVY